MIDFKLLMKTYKAIAEEEKKQEDYKKFLKRSFTYGMAEELARSVRSIGVKMSVKLADGTEVNFEPLPVKEQFPDFLGGV